MAFSFLSKVINGNIGADLGDKQVSCLLQGGLGNQLFILAAGLEQAERLSVPLLVDDSLYSSDYGRTQEVSELRVGLNVFFLSDTPGRPGSNLKSTIKQSTGFKEKSFRFDEEIFKVKFNTHLEGYFQSYKYFPSVGPKLLAAIKSVTHTPIDQELIDLLSSESFVSVHVRRGDYASNSSTQAFHGLTSGDFFQRALNLCKEISTTNRVLVFSDSPDEALSVLPKGLGFSYEIVPNHLSNFATLDLMSRGESILMSNSSFSWWASWIASNSGNLTRHVIAPRPWFAKDINTDDLLLPSWISIGN